MGNMKATQVLMDEHEAVKIILKVLEKINEKIKTDNEINLLHLGDIVEFLQIFVDKCHHTKEEQLLIPEVKKLGVDDHDNLIATILKEHEMGRSYVLGLKQALEKYKNGDKNALSEIVNNDQNYISLLTLHIDKEDKILYPRSDAVLSNEKDEKLYEDFEKVEEEKIGIGKHEQFHKMIVQLKGIYLS